jgi:predicted  nucleic acid-binding Zn-ribbon protein
MSILKAMLDYQEIDRNLLKIEKELNATEERKNYAKARKFMKNAQATLEGYESKAISLTGEYNDLDGRFKKLSEQLKEFSEIDYAELEGNEEEVAYLKKNAQTLADTLKGLKKTLQTVKEQMESMTQEYEKLKKQTIVMQKQYKDSKEKYDEVVKGRSEEVDKIKGELRALEKDIPPEILERYNNKRKEGLWPVLCKLNGDRCSVCSMDLPKAAISKFATSKVIECENCHRLIYKDE